MNYIDNNLVNISSLGTFFLCFCFSRNMDRLLRLGGGMPGLGQVSIYLINLFFKINKFWSTSSIILLYFKTASKNRVHSNNL